MMTEQMANPASTRTSEENKIPTYCFLNQKLTIILTVSMGKSHQHSHIDMIPVILGVIQLFETKM